MKRAYYTDPLAAIWMHDNHGFKLEFGDLKYPELAVRRRAMNKEPMIVHIAPESMHLLEPQVGDLLQIGRKSYRYGICDEAACNREIEGKTYHSISIDGFYEETRFVERIIQRNGKPFFWPEFEEAA